MENEKEIIKIKEKINKKFLQLDIDSDLHTAEEEQNIKNDIISLLCKLIKYVKSTISGDFVLTEKNYIFVYGLLEYEKTHDPLFIYEETDHRFTLWPNKQCYENDTEKIAEFKNYYELNDWLLKMYAENKIGKSKEGNHMSRRKDVLTEERAREIAEDFMSQVNPYDWHGVEARKGKGDDRPEAFGEKTISYDTGFEWGDELDITCEYDDDERRWVYHCELRDSDGDDILDDAYSWHIDDIKELVETIMLICES